MVAAGDAQVLCFSASSFAPTSASAAGSIMYKLNYSSPLLHTLYVCLGFTFSGPGEILLVKDFQSFYSLQGRVKDKKKVTSSERFYGYPPIHYIKEAIGEGRRDTLS